MKLDRNITQPRRGKYALIKLRPSASGAPIIIEHNAHRDSVLAEAIDYGESLETDFFVIRLKDKYAGPALRAYAEAAKADDPEYAAEIDALAEMAKAMIPKRIPD
jgi:hypothetical protein